MSFRIQNGLRKELCVTLRQWTRKQSTVAHLLAPVNYTQVSKFTSYFWRNDQWSVKTHPSGKRKLLSKAVAVDAEHISAGASTYPSISSSYPPPLSAVPYRPVPPLTLPRLLGIYAQLSKSRLTMFNVLTAMSAFAVFPLVPPHHELYPLTVSVGERILEAAPWGDARPAPEEGARTEDAINVAAHA